MKLYNIIKKYPAVILFCLALLIGLYNLDDYGIAWDEVPQQEIGAFNYDYVFKGDTALLNYHARDYGVAFELPLTIIERVFNMQDSRSVFLMRHLITHLFFLIGALFFYKLILMLFNSKWLGVIGFLMLLISPRIYADSYINTKDIPFLSLFFIAFYYIAQAFQNKTIKHFIVAAIITGLMINLRILGVMLLGGVVFFLLVDGLTSKQIKKHGILILIFAGVCILTTYISWPNMWRHPFTNFADAMSRMSKFNWTGTNFYKGQIVLATELSWDYIPTWFLVTTPILYILLAIIGLFGLLAAIIKNPTDFFMNTFNRNNLYYLFCFFAPVLLVIILKSVLYDGWRHLYFIYAPFMLICIKGLDLLLKTKLKTLTLVIVFLMMGNITWFMIKNHSVENVYFNEFVDTGTDEKLRLSYDLDYWGVSYRKSLEYIIKTDPSDTIRISADNSPGVFNVYILPEKQRNRFLCLPDTNGATYFVTNYRWHYADYESMESKKVFSVKVGHNTINAVYKLR